VGKLYVGEYAQSDWQTATEPPLAEQVVTFAASVQCSNAFHSSTRLVRVYTDAICSIAFGVNPTATTSNKRLAANKTEYFGVQGGYKVAAVTNT